MKKVTKKIEYFFPNIYSYNKCVLMVIVPQHEGSIGGSDAHVRDLSIELLKNKKYIPIVLFPHNYEYRDTLKKNNIPYIFAKGCKNKLDIVKNIRQIPNEFNINVIHSHQYDANYLTQYIKMFGGKSWKKIPVVMTCHGWVENNLKLKIMTYFDFKSYKYANSLIAVSKKDYKRLSNNKYSKNKKLYYIPNGIIHDYDYSELEREKINEKYNIKNKFVVGYVGRLSSEKRIDLLIEVAKKVIYANNDIMFIIAGNGDLRNFLLEKIKEYNLEKNVKYLGFIKNISEIHVILDIILITSDTEGTPRAVLESMSYGSICVSTDVGGLREIINNNENGYLCKPNDSESLCNTILKINEMSENEKNKMKIKSIKTIEQKFLISKMCEEISIVYDKLGG